MNRRNSRARTVVARDLARDLACAYALDLDLARAQLDRDLGLARDLDLARALDLARTLDRARDRARVLALDLDLDRALDLALSLDHELADGHDFDRAFAHARDLADVINHASVHACQFSYGRVRAGEGRPARGAIQLASGAVVVLARRDRPRYAEEYRAELAGLAAAGAGWWRQLRHAGRLLASAPVLRVSLAQARHRRETA